MSQPTDASKWRCIECGWPKLPWGGVLCGVCREASDAKLLIELGMALEKALEKLKREPRHD